MTFSILILFLSGMSAARIITYNPDDNLVDPLRLPDDLDEDDLDLSGRPLIASDLENGLKWLPPEGISPPSGGPSSVLYSSGHFEGDIMSDFDGPSFKNAIRDRNLLWSAGRIPYVLSKKYSDRERAVLAHAMKVYHDRTCIRFEAKTPTDYNFIYIYPGNGCASQVGRVGGMQFVSLGVGCVYTGIIQHELMHVAGFWHEQSRFDRDDYIWIIWDNIESGMEYNFDKYSWNDIQTLDAPYDYGSVMHYGTHAFAKGFGPTIQAKDGSSAIIGQRNGLSEMDIEKINRMYACSRYLKSAKYTTRFVTGNATLTTPAG